MADGIESRVHELESQVTDLRISDGKQDEKIGNMVKSISGLGEAMSTLRSGVVRAALGLAAAVILSGIVNGLLTKVFNGGGQ